MPPIDIYHESAGEGSPTTVLLHPGCADSRIFDAQWDRYRERFRTLRPDMRGFGRSPIESPPVTYGRDVARLLENRDVGASALIGLSLGGRVALELTIERPDLVTALVLVGVARPDTLATSSLMARHTEHLIGAFRRGDLDAAVELSLRTSVDGPRRTPDEVDPAARTKMAMMQCDAYANTRGLAGRWREERLVSGLTHRLHEIRVPTLVLVGDLDLDIVQSEARALAAEIPGARLQTIGRAAHLPSLEQPDAFDALVLPFLTDTQPKNQEKDKE